MGIELPPDRESEETVANVLLGILLGALIGGGLGLGGACCVNGLTLQQLGVVALGAAILGGGGGFFLGSGFIEWLKEHWL